jgi:hypothetical protein
VTLLALQIVVDGYLLSFAFLQAFSMNKHAASIISGVNSTDPSSFVGPEQFWQRV